MALIVKRSEFQGFVVFSWSLIKGTPSRHAGESDGLPFVPSNPSLTSARTGEKKTWKNIGCSKGLSPAGESETSAPVDFSAVAGAAQSA